MVTILYVNLGGAGCQIKGREDPSCLGENQGGAGQKGRTVFASDDHRLVVFAAPPHVFVNFIHSEAPKCEENRSLQCLILCVCVCVSAGEGARNQKDASERCQTMQAHSRQNILFRTKRALIFGRRTGRRAPLKSSVGKSELDSTDRPFFFCLNQ